MLFNSLHFLLFFLLVTPAWFILPQKLRIKFLLAASCYFYMVFIPVYILILLVTILIDYFAGIYIERATGKKKKLFLVISIVSNISFLAFFKYFNFLNENASALLNSMGIDNHVPFLSILLPIGLSFHTFQAMSYTIEVYRGKQKAERDFFTYSLYVMFYPQLVAGPIERPQNLLGQLKQKHSFNYQRVADGLKLMVWGMFKKVVIADRLAELVNTVYNSPESYAGMPLIIATVFFSFQIYCDFSAYSDIAIGTAQIMGVKLMKNFNRPYFSKTIAEFWTRWHISLSTWFRDYLYIPLGGNRVKKGRWIFNLSVTFLISGLWHGASWNFITWGAIHASYLIAAILLNPFKNSINGLFKLNLQGSFFKISNAIIVFIMVSFAWIFFRAATFEDAQYIVSNLLPSLTGQLSYANLSNIDFLKRNVFLGTDGMNFGFVLLCLAGLITVELLQRKGSLTQRVSASNILIKWSCYAGIIALILYFGMFDNGVQFIYFQF